MQGGIRRKKDLLPRYKNGNGRGKKGAFLTTPMKKILIYVTLLTAVFVLLRIGYSDLNKDISYELDSPGEQTAVAGTNGEVRVPKEQFNNEVAKQQEVKNLENDNKPPAPAAAPAGAAAAVAEPNKKVPVKDTDRKVAVKGKAPL